MKRAIALALVMIAGCSSTHHETAHPAAAPRRPTSTTLDWRAARSDIPPLPDCYQKPVSQCTIVKGTGPSLLLMGDSIARMWLPAFIAIAKRDSLTLSIAAFPTCPWQPTIEHGLHINGACPPRREDWYHRVIPLLHPDVVVLAERAYDKPGNPFHFPNGLLASSPGGEARLVRASEAAFEKLRTPGRKIVVLDSPPLPPLVFDPDACLSTGEHRCAFTVNTTPTALERFESSGQKQYGFTSIDVDRLACPNLPRCDPIVNHMIVRRDPTHFTATYARSLAGPMESILRERGVLGPNTTPSG